MLTLSAIGGNGETMKVLIGENIESLLKARTFEWNTYELTEKSARNTEKLTFLIKTVNEIFNFPEYIDKEDDLILMLNSLFNKSPAEIFNALVRSFIIYDPLNYAYKNLFWKIKEFIENLIILSYPNEDIQSKLLKWEKNVSDTNIDTSSVILWTLYNKQSPFRTEELKNSKFKFEYLGYCPYKPVDRICAILKFPFNEFENTIQHTIKLTEFHSKINKILSVNNLCNNILSDAQLTMSHSLYDTKLEAQIDMQSDITHLDSFSKTESIKKYVKQWLNLAEKIKPLLKEKENEYISLAKTLNLAAKEFENQTEILIKKLDMN